MLRSNVTGSIICFCMYIAADVCNCTAKWSSAVNQGCRITYLDGNCLWVELCHQLVQGSKVLLNLVLQVSTWRLILLQMAGLVFSHQEQKTLCTSCNTLVWP